MHFDNKITYRYKNVFHFKIHFCFSLEFFSKINLQDNAAKMIVKYLLWTIASFKNKYKKVCNIKPKKKHHALCVHRKQNNKNESFIKYGRFFEVKKMMMRKNMINWL